MLGALSVVGSSVMDSHASPCLCLDVMPTAVKGSGELVLQRYSVKRKKMNRSGGKSLELGNSFVDSWLDWRYSSKAISNTINRSSRKHQRMDRRFVIVSEILGQYDEGFDDVKKQILNYFTYKAVRTVLNQLHEMNPTQYRWFYDFVATNNPRTGKRFIRILVKEKQDLAERVMITRLQLYGRWVKKCDHAQMYQEISEENLALMRERLTETVIWPSDDTNTQKIDS